MHEPRAGAPESLGVLGLVRLRAPYPMISKFRVEGVGLSFNNVEDSGL